MPWSIKVVWNDGEEEFLRQGHLATGPPAIFATRRRAEEMRDFMLEGMADEVQSVNVTQAAQR